MEIITELLGNVGNGVTNPFLAFIGDKQVVAKSIKNDETFISLFNELCGYEIANQLNFYHPSYGIAYFKQGTTDVRNININFDDNEFFTYTEYIDKVLPIVATNMANSINNEQIIKLLLFDLFICNTDRNMGNILIQMPGKTTEAKLVPIDYTHIFPGRCLWPDILRQGITSIEYLFDEVIHNGHYQYLIENKTFTNEEVNECYSKMKERIDQLDVDMIIKRIPDLLTEKLNENDINRLKGFIKSQKDNFEQYKELLIQRIVR